MYAVQRKQFYQQPTLNDDALVSYRSSYPLSILVTSVDKTLKILDYATGEVRRFIETAGMVTEALSFALPGRRLHIAAQSSHTMLCRTP
jgi:hypothetical protein